LTGGLPFLRLDWLQHDPAEGYHLDLATGPRENVRDREMALSYVRHAHLLAHASDAEILTRFGEVSRAVSHLEDTPETATRRLIELHRRHGRSVSDVMLRLLAESTGQEHPDSLVSMYRAYQTAQSAGAGFVMPKAEPVTGRVPATVELRFDRNTERVTIAGGGQIGGVGFEVLDTLAATFLEDQGQGLDPEDHRARRANWLAREWGVTEEAVRRRVLRLRQELSDIGMSAGLDHDLADIIENVPNHGYRLNTDLVRLRIDGQDRTPAKAPTTRHPQ
jgi:hypothetical protein